MKKWLLMAIMVLMTSQAYALTVNLTPEADKDETNDSFLKQYGYKETVVQDGVEVTNPVTKEEAAKKVVNSFIEESAVAYDLNAGAEAWKKANIDAIRAKHKVKNS